MNWSSTRPCGSQNPAERIPLVGEYLGPELVWNAVIGYDLETETVTDYRIVDDDTFATLVSMFNGAEGGVAGGVAEMIAQYSPVPESVRKILGLKIPILERDVLELLEVLHTLDPRIPEIDTTVLRLLVDPEGNVSELQDGRDSNGVVFNIDILDTSNIIKLLTGQVADIVSLDLFANEPLYEASFSAPEDIPIFSFFGLADVKANGALNLDLGFKADVSLGFDTQGFYIAESGTDDSVVDVQLGLGGSVTVVGTLLQLDMAELEIGAYAAN